MSKYLKFDTPASAEAVELKSEFGLKNHGFLHLDKVYWNLPDSALYEEAIFRKEAKIAKNGPLLVHTGKHTARAAADKYIVREDSTSEHIWWGEYNRPYSTDKFNALWTRVQAYAQDQEFFVQDVYAGSDPEYRMRVRIITEFAWHSLFARNMFITTADSDDLKHFIPEFTVVAVPGFKADPRIDGTRSNTAIVLNFAERLAIIANTEYGGEIKKSIFTVLNFLLTFRRVLPMHCSANVGPEGDAALFFGLSGTGKTTLSADPNRKLIGDDEHGWSNNGIFNFEGGCYAKVIRLSADNEPEIYDCTRRFGTILENVVMDPVSRHIDLEDDMITENTRASYPLEFIPNVMPGRKAIPTPKTLFF
jgi:phosphoenolpyruvate carboxykinase (ATP)